MVSFSTLTWYNIFLRDLVFKFTPPPINGSVSVIVNYLLRGYKR